MKENLAMGDIKLTTKCLMDFDDSATSSQLKMLQNILVPKVVVNLNEKLSS